MRFVNFDRDVVEAFGEEWDKFDQSGLTEDDLRKIFHDYFTDFPWESLPESAHGFDLGCGSGRWAKFVAPHVGEMFCIDPSEKALKKAGRNLSSFENCHLLLADAENIPLDDCSMDFGYSLGVLHHIPDTAAGLRACVKKLKIGAPFLLYLYYAFDNRPPWFKALWVMSDRFRTFVSKAPTRVKHLFCEILALSVYYPMAKLSGMLERCGVDVWPIPLSYYRNQPFYVMRNDALDRFGTKVEKRFRRDEMEKMMRDAGLEKIQFNQHAPYWCAIGYRSDEAK